GSGGSSKSSPTTPSASPATWPEGSASWGGGGDRPGCRGDSRRPAGDPPDRHGVWALHDCVVGAGGRGALPPEGSSRDAADGDPRGRPRRALRGRAGAARLGTDPP